MEFERKLLTTAKQLEELGNKLHSYDRIGFDTESSGPDRIHDKFLNVYRSDLTGYSIATPDGYSYYTPVSHKKGNAPYQHARWLLSQAVSHKGRVAIHNAKHEYRVLALEGFSQPQGAVVCTQVLCWLLQLSEGGYGLKYLSKVLLDIEMATFDETTGGLPFCALDPKDGLDYAAQDAEVALLLMDRYMGDLSRYKGMREAFWYREMPYVEVLQHMEDSGMALDETNLQGTIAEFKAKRDDLKAKWEKLCEEHGLFRFDKCKPCKGEGCEACNSTGKVETGQPISMTSSAQMQLLYQRGHWDTGGFDTEAVPETAHGFSTAKDYVEMQERELDSSELGKQLATIKLEHGVYQKLVTTYGEKLLKIAWQYPDNRLHCGYHHTGTATGRLSSSGPNLQNIPTRTEEGKRIRDAFVAAPGWKLVSADYSQIELRVLAHFCKKGKLFEGYASGADVHQMVADELNTSRDNGKTTNFASVYGVGPKKLARKLGMTYEECKDFLNQYRTEFAPEVVTLLERASAAAKAKGYVRTLGGRIRHTKLLEAEEKHERAKQRYGWKHGKTKKAWAEMGSEERKAGNTPIQGGARDIMVIATLEFYRRMDKDRCKIIAQVHDDLVTEMREDYVEEGSKLLKECMETAYPLRVPLIAEPQVGDRWSELK